jgi:hypothetical protein
LKFKCDPTGYASIQAAYTDATVATVGFVVAGVGAAAGVVFLLLTPSPASAPPSDGQKAALRPSAAVVPLFGGGASGAALVGRF